MRGNAGADAMRQGNVLRDLYTGIVTAGKRCITALGTRARRFWRDTEAAVGVIGAVTLPALIGVAALSLEYGNGLLVRVETQRVADIATYSAAVAYTRAGGDRQQKRLAAEQAANSIAALNGVSTERIILIFNEDDTIVRANLRSEQRLILARVIDGASELDVVVSAVARIGEADGAACVVALDPGGSGIVMSGSADITALDCGVASNAGISMNQGCSTEIITDVAFYQVLPNPAKCIRTADGAPADLVQKETGDPLADDPALAAARAAIADTEALNFSPSGENIRIFSWENPQTRDMAQAAGCEATYSGNIWHISCPGPTVSLGRIDVEGSGKAEFSVSSSSPVFEIGKIEMGGSTSLTFPPATFRIGTGSGDAINTGGSSNLNLGGLQTTSEAVNIRGDVRTAGGSCIIFGRANWHRIQGNLRILGAVVFGAGPYVIDGYFDLSAGGWHQCNGQPMTASGDDVTFIMSGRASCGSGNAFCAGGGFSNMRLTAPENGLFANILMIGPLDATATWGGASFSGGTSGALISGAIYFPNGTIAFSGNSSASSLPGSCVQLIGSAIDVRGSANTEAGNCLESSGAGAGVPIVQLIQ